MYNNSKFWDNFYKKHTLLKESNFSKFIIKKITNKNNILDVGCGDGRDTFYFNKYFNEIYGIDKSRNAIKNNMAKNIFKNIKFKKIDITKKDIKLKKFTNIYARFFLHTLNSYEENLFLINSYKLLNKKGLLCLEFRTNRDSMFKKGKKISSNEHITDHYRRFIDVNTFKENLKKLRFKILYFSQGKNYSIYKNQNPHLARFIVQK